MEQKMQLKCARPLEQDVQPECVMQPEQEAQPECVMQPEQENWPEQNALLEFCSAGNQPFAACCGNCLRDRGKRIGEEHAVSVNPSTSGPGDGHGGKGAVSGREFV